MSSQIPRPRQRGSALILVLWALLILSMAVIGVVGLVQLSVEHTSHQESIMEAEALAQSGLALGMDPQLLKNDPLLAQKIDATHQFKTTIGSEGARLNLNFILLSGHREILENLFTNWGLTKEAIDHVIDCLLDWIGPAGQHSLNGATDSDYAAAGLSQRPSHQPFVSLDEVALVMGMDAVIKAKPDWQDSFTLWSSGPLDVNQAPAEILAPFFGLNINRMQSFVEARNGPDGIVGTTDDIAVPNLQTLEEELGLSDEAIAPLSKLITLNDPVRRIESVGQANGHQVTISVVTRLGSVPPQMLLWSEQ